MVILLCFESESYSEHGNFVAEKNWPIICSVQIKWGFYDSLPFYNAGSWVSALSLIGPLAISDQGNTWLTPP